MSTTRKTLYSTGSKDAELAIIEMWGGEKKKAMLQLTQGTGGIMERVETGEDTPGYIQLTTKDAYLLISELTSWLKTIAKIKAQELSKQIEKDKSLKNTIIEEAVKCERFIADFELLELPLRLLNLGGK